MAHVLKFGIWESMIFEAEGTSKFNFTNSFPDNIAFPVKKGTQDNKDIKPDELTGDFRKFLKELKAAVENGASVDKITVKSGASKEGANLNVPDGYTKELVIASYGTSDASQVSNEELAKNRGQATIALIKKFIPQLAGTNFELSSEVGTEKYVTVTVPSEAIVNVRASSDYKKPAEPFTEDKIQRIKTCDDPIQATGSAGNPEKGYLADMIVLDMESDYEAQMTLKYNAYFIPDNFVVKRRQSGTGEFTEQVAASGFVTSASGSKATGLQNSLKAYFKDAKVVPGAGEGELKFTKDKGYDYAIMIYAPFGGTQWSASLTCAEKEFNWKNISNYPKLYIDGDGNVSQQKPANFTYKDRIVIGEFETGSSEQNVKAHNGKLIPGLKLKNGYVLDDISRGEVRSQITYRNGRYTGARGNMANPISNYGIA